LIDSEDVTFALDSELRLLYRNPARDRFALENDAPELAKPAVIGTILLRVIPGSLRVRFGPMTTRRWFKKPARIPEFN
jgi:hypothetical protein